MLDAFPSTCSEVLPEQLVEQLGSPAKKLIGDTQSRIDEMKSLKERTAVTNPMAEPKVVGNDGDGAD